MLSNKTEDLVCRLNDNLRAGHVIIGDNYFTSLNLNQRLLANKKILYFGTIRKNRKEIPKVIKIVKGIPEFSSKFISYEGNTMVSYSRKKNANVILLSNFHHKTETSNSNKRKPKIIEDYNANKSGVDSLDQQINAFRPYRSTRRWPCVIFSDLLAFAIHASWVIFRLKYSDSPLVEKKDRKDFLYQLGHQLVTPLIKKRRESPDYKYLHRDVKLSMDYMIKICEDSISQTNSLLTNASISSLLVASDSGNIHPSLSEICPPTEPELGVIVSSINEISQLTGLEDCVAIDAPPIELPLSTEAELGDIVSPINIFSQPTGSEDGCTIVIETEQRNAETPIPRQLEEEICVDDVQAKNYLEEGVFIARDLKIKK